MAKGKKTGGRDWKPGECPNPAGRPPLPAEINEIKRLDKAKFEEVLHRFLYLPKEELKRLIESPGTPMIEILVGTIITKGGDHGDPMRLGFLLERILGRAPLRVEHTGADGGPIRTKTEQDMTDEELEAELTRLRGVVREPETN